MGAGSAAAAMMLKSTSALATKGWFGAMMAVDWLRCHRLLCFYGRDGARHGVQVRWEAEGGLNERHGFESGSMDGGMLCVCFFVGCGNDAILDFGLSVRCTKAPEDARLCLARCLQSEPCLILSAYCA